MKYLSIFLVIVVFGVMGWVIMDTRNEVVGLKNRFEVARAQIDPPQHPAPAYAVADQTPGTIPPLLPNAQAPAPAAAPVPGLDTPLPPPPPLPVSTGDPAQDLAQSVKNSQALTQQINERSGTQTLPPAGVVPSPAPPVVTEPTTGTMANGSLTPPPPLPQIGEPASPQAPPSDLPLTQRQRLVQSSPAIGKITEYFPNDGVIVLSAGTSLNLEANMNFSIRRGHSIIGRVKILEVEADHSAAEIESRSIPAGVTVEVGDDIIQDLPPVQ